MPNIKIGLTGILALIFVTAPLLSEATSLGERPRGNIAVSEEFDHDLQLILETEKAIYQSEEPIVITLTLANKGLKPMEITFPSAQKYDFIVKKDKEEIWRWSQDKMFAMMLTKLVLQPNQSFTYKEIWTQEDDEGGYVLPGTYEIIGILKTHPEIVSRPLTIKIIFKKE